MTGTGTGRSVRTVDLRSRRREQAKPQWFVGTMGSPFLASDDLSFINGIELFADGGTAQV